MNPIEFALNSPIFGFVTLIFAAIFYAYADDGSWVRAGKVVEFLKKDPLVRKAILGVPHGLVHVAAATTLTYLFIVINSTFLYTPPWSWRFVFLLAAEMIGFGGMVAGTIFGLYLLLSCYVVSAHPNDAFSSMSLDSHRHFLRLRIQGDELKIFPVCLDSVPQREDWQENSQSTPNSSEPLFVPKVPLNPRLIEGPILIRTQQIIPVGDAKPRL